MTLVAVQLPQEWENIKLGILYFCLKKKKSIISIHIFLANSSYIAIPISSQLRSGLLLCVQSGKNQKTIYISNDSYNGETNY